MHVFVTAVAHTTPHDVSLHMQHRKTPTSLPANATVTLCNLFSPDSCRPLFCMFSTHTHSHAHTTHPQAERVSICSIEKANGAINRMIQEQRLHELVSVTIDEAHMLADPNRWVCFVCVVLSVITVILLGASVMF